MKWSSADVSGVTDADGQGTLASRQRLGHPHQPAYKGTAMYGKTRGSGERRPRLRPVKGQPEQPRRGFSSYEERSGADSDPSAGAGQCRVCSRRWRSNWPRIKSATARARAALLFAPRIVGLSLLWLRVVRKRIERRTAQASCGGTPTTAVWAATQRAWRPTPVPQSSGACRLSETAVWNACVRCWRIQGRSRRNISAV